MTTGIYTEYDDEDDVKFDAINFNPTQVKLEDVPELEGSITRASKIASTDMAYPAGSKRKFEAAELDEKSPLDERVVKAARTINVVPTANEIQQVIDLIDKRRAELEDPNVELSQTDTLPANVPEEDRRSFYIQVNMLVADIMRLISKLNDKERHKTDHMKREYGVLNNEVGEAISKRGSTGFWSNVGALLVRVGGGILGGALGSDALQKTTDMIGQQIPGLTDILKTGHEVTQSKGSNRITLLSTDMQNAASKTSDNSGWKNEIIQLLDQIKQLLTAAARAN